MSQIARFSILPLVVGLFFPMLLLTACSDDDNLIVEKEPEKAIRGISPTMIAINLESPTGECLLNPNLNGTLFKQDFYVTFNDEQYPINWKYVEHIADYNEKGQPSAEMPTSRYTPVISHGLVAATKNVFNGSLWDIDTEYVQLLFGHVNRDEIYQMDFILHIPGSEQSYAIRFFNNYVFDDSRGESVNEMKLWLNGKEVPQKPFYEQFYPTVTIVLDPAEM